MKNRSGEAKDPTSHSETNLQLQEKSTTKWMVLIAIGIGTFMSALDGSVVNTTLPILRQTFSSSVSAIEWVVTIYLLVLSGLLLGFGRLGDLTGHKRVYLAGFVVFILGSALCGFALTLPMLVFFRGFQAFGAAMLQANSPAILTGSFPDRQRGQALGLQATMTYLGLTIGPALGGWLAGQFGWRSIFYINIPVGILAFLLSYRFIISDKKPLGDKAFDFTGGALFIIGLVLLLLGLNQASAFGWSSWPILLSLFAALALLMVFIMVERREPYPMLDLHLFSNRIFSVSVISAVINYIGVYSIIFLMPFYLIQGLKLPPAQAGLILTIMPVVMAVLAPLSGSISDRVGTRLPAIVGMLLLTGGLVLLASLPTDFSLWEIGLRLCVAGAGIGIFISPNNNALMGSAPRSRQGIAAGILATSRNFGMVLGVGVAGAVFTSFLEASSILSGASIIPAIQASFMVAAGITAAGVVLLVFQNNKPQARSDA